MKKFSFLFVLLLTIGTVAQLSAQAERYTAQTVVDYANGHAKNGATDTHLSAIITINGAIPTPLGTINLNYSFDDGKNLIWLYMYYSPSMQKHFLYGISRVNAFGNAVNTAFEVDPALIGIDVLTAPKKEISTPILGSEFIEARLKTNASFNAFQQDYPDSQPNLIILTRLDDEQLSEFTMLNGEDPYWVVQYINEQDPNYPMLCFVNTKNDEVVCIRSKDITSVTEPKKPIESMSVVPNPSSSSMNTIHFKQPIAGGTLRMYNSLGTMVKDLTSLVNTTTTSLPLSTDGLPSGMYILQHQNGTQTFTTKFVIQ